LFQARFWKAATTVQKMTDTPDSQAETPFIPEDRTLLIVDDDMPFLARLARAMESRGFEVTTASTVRDGKEQARAKKPGFAVVDLRLEDGNGLDVVAAMQDARPEARIVVLTGYGNIATAGAEAALLARGGDKAPPPENPMAADRVRWEHIQRVYELCDRNVSETARRLNMHRRTLQRILAKRVPK